MGRGLILLNDGQRDYFLEWSTVVDAPVTYGMDRQDLERWTKDELGNEGMRELPMRLRRLELTGTSFQASYLDEIIPVNRAGKDETCLGYRALVEVYCHGKPNRRGHKHTDDGRCSSGDDVPEKFRRPTDGRP